MREGLRTVLYRVCSARSETNLTTVLADLLAIDLDGTFLTRERDPHPRHIDAVARAQAAGMRVIFASGRIRPSMLRFAEPVNAVNPMICANGAHVVGPDAENWQVHRLDLEALKTVVEYAERNQVHASIYTPDHLYFLHDTAWGDQYAARVRSTRPEVKPFDEILGEDVVKVLLLDNPERIPEHSKCLVPQIDPSRCRVTESEPEYLEFLAPQATKGAALSDLAKLLGVVPSRTAAIGDYLNDIEMLDFAGHSAAIGNAHPTILARVQRVVGTNTEGGVADFVDWLLQDQRQ